MTGLQRWQGTHLGPCPTCGKRRYETKKQARRTARRAHPGVRFSFYRCGGYWHYGHLPSAVRRGDAGRPDIPAGRLPRPKEQQHA